jgi:nicotinate-nucleotide adenylyltransferase
MKLAILGGSFNPLHLGHLFLAETVLSAFDYDRIIMIPAFQSPFKLSSPGMGDSSRDRLDMIAASIAGDPHLTLEDCEVRREGVSYTIDTVKDIIARYIPEGKPGLILGDDLAKDFPKWRNFDELIELADIIIARRIHSEEQSWPFPCRQIKNEVMELSSAQVRERIAAGKGWRYLVPAAARTIIEDRRLYGLLSPAGIEAAGNAKSGLTRDLIIRVENAVRESLSPSRFLHSRNTALLAWDLCRRFGLDPELGYLAGIAHDMAKPLDGKAVLHLAKSGAWEISDLERSKPSLLHGKAAAVLLRKRFDIHNEDVLEAVAWHTGGRPGMGSLTKIIYIADKIEVSREQVDSAIRKACFTADGGKTGETCVSLDQLFSLVMKSTVEWLRSENLKLSDETLCLIDKIQEKKDL